MRPEHHRTGLGRAVGIGGCGARQRLAQGRHQARAHRRRSHAHEFDARQVGAGQRRALAQHHRDHRRHGGEPGAAIAPDRFDIGGRGKLRQQHDGGVGGASELCQRQRVHVIERRRDQITMAIESRHEPRLHHPDMALVRQHDALRRAGRSRRVEEHRRLVGPRYDDIERPGIEEGLECGAERHAADTGRAIGLARPIAKHEFRAGIADDEVNGVAREFEIHRHRDQAGAHDAVIGRDIFGAIGGEQCDAVAALQTAPQQRAGDRVGGGVELCKGKFPRAVLATKVDDRELCKIAIARDQVAEISEFRVRDCASPERPPARSYRLVSGWRPPAS